MGVDHTAGFFFGALIVRAEYERIWTLENQVDEWFEEFGLDYNGTDEIGFFEAGDVAYSWDVERGAMFVVAQATLVEAEDRRWPMFTQVDRLPLSAVDAEAAELAVRRFVHDHNIPVERFGWFSAMRVW